MRLVEIEKNINDLIEKDIKDPNIYKEIYNLSLFFLKRGHLLNSDDDNVGVATLMAEDLYLMIYNGKEIRSWLSYISRCYHAYIRNWKFMSGTQIIDTDKDNNIKLHDAIIDMNCCHRASDDFKEMLDSVYLEDICNIIKGVLSKSRFMEFTPEYLNAEVTLKLSIIAGKYVSIFQTPENEIYTRLIFNLLKETIRENIKSVSTTSEDLYSLQQLFSMGECE